MYTFDSIVRYSEINQDGYLKPSTLIQYLQDCSCFQSESLGDGWKQAMDKGVAWVLIFWQIVVEAYPSFADKIQIGTKAWGFTPLFGHRNFAIQDLDGNYYVKANSLWVQMDLKKGHPVRLAEEVTKRYPVEEKLQMNYCERRIGLPKEMESKPPILVRPHHIDTNHHVNNAAYMEMAMEVLGEQICPKEIRIEYKMQAKLGDFVYPRVGMQEDFLVVSLEDEKGKSYAVIALRM